MPKLNKRTRQSRNAIKKRWENVKNLKETEESEKIPLELSDAEPDIDEFNESWFNTFWTEGEITCFNNNEINKIEELQPNALEQLIENVKSSYAWTENSRKPVYNGAAQSTLRNKKAYWKKAALGSKKITDMFSINETVKPNTNSTIFTFEDTYDSSDDDENEFTLESLDSLLKKKKDDVRLRMVSQFLHLVQDHGFTKMDASNLLAQSLNKGPWQARLIRSWANQWLNKGTIITSKRGRHAKIRSLLLHEDFKLRVTEYLRMHKFELNVADFVKFIEDEVIPALGIEEKTNISYSTARGWLHILGWEYKDHSKNIYFDGHEREDVVLYRYQFLQQWAELRKRMATYEGENLDQIILPVLPHGVLEIIPITHDESIFYANDDVTKAWGPADENRIRRKSQGLSIHVSDFLCESIGRLQLSEEECIINNSLPDGERLVYTEACVTMYPGTNRDGWWTSKDVVKQVKERAIPIFERTHPGKVALFMFDNSCNHNAFAEDALIVSRMNIKDGGKQPLLRNGKMPDGSPHVMTFTDVDGTIKPKGIRRVLEERGLWIPGLKRKCKACAQHNPDPIKLDCCATRILSAQPDFASQKIHLQEVSRN